MDLLSTLSAASGGLAARPGVSSGGGCGDDACGSGGDGFVATLAQLLEPASASVAETTLEQLAELASAAADEQEASALPLGLLLEIAGARFATDSSEVTVDGDPELDAELPSCSTDTDGEMSSDHAADGEGADAIAAVEADAPVLSDEPDRTPVVDSDEGGEVDQAGPADTMPTGGHGTADTGGTGGTAADASRTDDPTTDRPRDARPGVTATADDGSSRLDPAPVRAATRRSAAAVDPDEVTPQRSARADMPSTGSSMADPARAADHVPPPAASATSSMDPGSRAVSMADGVRRVLEVIELLENAPPPRHLTIDVGEARLRVGLDDNVVRVTVLDGASDDLDELLRDAEQALAEQGFDLGGERDGRGEPDQQRSDRLTAPPSRVTRADARGLRL